MGGSTLQERQLVSMADLHMGGALEWALTAENWWAPVTIRTAIDWRIVNAGAQLYRKFNNKHLIPLIAQCIDDNFVYLQVRTSRSNIHVAQAARTRAFIDGQELHPSPRVVQEEVYIAQDLTVDIAQRQTLVLEKLATLYTSRDDAISEPGLEARRPIVRAACFEAVMTEHARAWKQ